MRTQPAILSLLIVACCAVCVSSQDETNPEVANGGGHSEPPPEDKGSFQPPPEDMGPAESLSEAPAVTPNNEHSFARRRVLFPKLANRHTLTYRPLKALVSRLFPVIYGVLSPRERMLVDRSTILSKAVEVSADAISRKLPTPLRLLLDIALIPLRVIVNLYAHVRGWARFIGDLLKKGGHVRPRLLPRLTLLALQLFNLFSRDPVAKIKILIPALLLWLRIALDLLRIALRTVVPNTPYGPLRVALQRLLSRLQSGVVLLHPGRHLLNKYLPLLQGLLNHRALLKEGRNSLVNKVVSTPLFRAIKVRRPTSRVLLHLLLLPLKVLLDMYARLRGHLVSILNALRKGGRLAPALLFLPRLHLLALKTTNLLSRDPIAKLDALVPSVIPRLRIILNNLRILSRTVGPVRRSALFLLSLSKRRIGKVLQLIFAPTKGSLFRFLSPLHGAARGLYLGLRDLIAGVGVFLVKTLATILPAVFTLLFGILLSPLRLIAFPLKLIGAPLRSLYMLPLNIVERASKGRVTAVFRRRARLARYLSALHGAIGGLMLSVGRTVASLPLPEIMLHTLPAVLKLVFGILLAVPRFILFPFKVIGAMMYLPIKLISMVVQQLIKMNFNVL